MGMATYLSADRYAIQIESDRAELKGVRNVDKIFNLKFNPSLFSDKQVILIDDVLNSGTGFIQIKRKLIDLGAKSVIGVFLVKTKEEE